MEDSEVFDSANASSSLSVSVSKPVKKQSTLVADIPDSLWLGTAAMVISILALIFLTVMITVFRYSFKGADGQMSFFTISHTMAQNPCYYFDGDNEIINNRNTCGNTQGILTGGILGMVFLFILGMMFIAWIVMIWLESVKVYEEPMGEIGSVLFVLFGCITGISIAVIGFVPIENSNGHRSVLAALCFATVIMFGSLAITASPVILFSTEKTGFRIMFGIAAALMIALSVVFACHSVNLVRPELLAFLEWTVFIVVFFVIFITGLGLVFQ